MNLYTEFLCPVIHPVNPTPGLSIKFLPRKTHLGGMDKGNHKHHGLHRPPEGSHDILSYREPEGFQSIPIHR